MTGRELFMTMGEHRVPDRIPFIPTIYEHAARFIGKTPSDLAADEDLLVEGQLACYRRYRHDLISVGLDIYNIECEALGAAVDYYRSNELPSIKEVLLENPADLDNLSIPDPENAARMPMMLSATERIHREVGAEVIVNGAVVGPFTLAAILRGFENFIVDLMTDFDFANKLLSFAMDVGLGFAKAFINRGLGISINESWIAPPLLSPAMYEQYVFPSEKKMIAGIKDLGQNNVALICGGDTTPIASLLVDTGTSLLLADSNSDQRAYVDLCRRGSTLLRASISPKLLENGSEAELLAAIEKVIETCGSYSGFIFGCGIVSFDTKPERVDLLRSMVNSTARPY
ncbi:MAG: hypothetical protein HN368_06500 [Spirochaetales bacterium]|jgi:uroporphyrinogen decarboxylase|nr:hypothetical protein [Spirochaetales bacterium]